VIDAPAAWISAPLLDQVTPGARFAVALVVASVACLYLAITTAVRHRRLARIPIRIHVAGTRGKSAVTRLVAAGLRAGGHRVVAKTTGTQPRLILPDGSEVPVRRWGATSIREQSGLVDAALHARADAIVVEAMAIEPEYLAALERFYIRATSLLITNLRVDHQEQLGDAPDAMALAVTRALPPGGHVFVTAEAASAVVREKARQLRCRLTVVETMDGSDPEAANLALARAICRHHGITDPTAEAAMSAARKDIGAFTLQPMRIDGRSVIFANAFSCNDVESFRQLWHRHHPSDHPAAFLFNARTDRPLRSRAFLALLPQLCPEAALYVTQGSGALRRMAVKAGFERSRVHILADGSAQNHLARIAREIAEGTVIWGTGNFQGAGAEITVFAKAAARSC